MRGGVLLLFALLALSGSQATAAPVPAADFAAAARACIEAVSPDRLDTGKLVAMGWVREGEERAPFGPVGRYSHGGAASTIYASPHAQGYCIVDGYAKVASDFDTYQSALAARFKADFGLQGTTDVSMGKPGDEDRRQGFVVGHAVAAYSGVARPDGLDLRFTVVNVAGAGSPAVFQKSRPPISDAEIAENRTRSLKARDYAKQSGNAVDLAALTRDCIATMRGDKRLPGDGWQSSIHSIGTPRAKELLARRDYAGMMADMANTRETFYRAGRRGYVTKYYLRGPTIACAATIYADPAVIPAIRAELATLLPLGSEGNASGFVRNFGKTYATALERSARVDRSELAVAQGIARGLDSQGPEQSGLTIFVF